jgi:hypothetical protein
MDIYRLMLGFADIFQGLEQQALEISEELCHCFQEVESLDYYALEVPCTLYKLSGASSSA